MSSNPKQGKAVKIADGWYLSARHINTSHCDDRPTGEVSLLVIHNISLPPGEFGRDYVSPFFTGNLDPADSDYFALIHQMRVSAHCFIRRDGEVIQYVPFQQRAWHAGVSVFQGRSACNDFAVGIELEGTDDLPYTDAQYRQLTELTSALQVQYPAISIGRIVGHNDIAPGRKTDPGTSFDWCRYRKAIGLVSLYKETQ